MKKSSGNNNSDRRVLRTRESLRKALVALIAQKGYDAISVQDILDHANVGRTTFYAHFTGKNALLLNGFDELEKALREHTKTAARGQADRPRRLHFSLPLLQHADDHRRVFLAIVGRRSSFIVQTRMQKLILDLVREELTELSGQRRDAKIENEARAQFCAGAFFSLLGWWLERRTGLNAEEVDQIFHQHCRKGLL